MPVDTISCEQLHFELLTRARARVAELEITVRNQRENADERAASVKEFYERELREVERRTVHRQPLETALRLCWGSLTTRQQLAFRDLCRLHSEFPEQPSLAPLTDSDPERERNYVNGRTPRDLD